jgi:hypothetical protein
MSQRRCWAGLGLGIALIVASIPVATGAWAKYSASSPCGALSCSETNSFAAHVLLAPGQPTCSGLGVLSVTLTWTVTDAKALTYDLGASSTSGGPYSYTNVGSGNTTHPSLSNGRQYFDVRAVNHSWTGPPSAEQQVTGVVIIVPVAATCP